MSAEDLEVVRSSFGPWNEDDFDALSQFYTDDVVFHSAHADLVGRTVQGKDALREAIAAGRADWSAMRWEIDELFETETGVVSLHRVIAVGRTSGIEVTNEIAAIYELRDGRI